MSSPRRQVEFIEQVPKSASGTILRRELRAREEKAQTT
jgi:acyl-CoA synthetase (AMP-forming)/AMP-acid ligase II